MNQPDFLLGATKIAWRSFHMKRQISLEGAALSILMLTTTAAFGEITFVCHGGPGTECAFSIVHPDGTGTTNLVIEPGQKQGVNDNFQGGSYCVVVSRPR